MRAPAAALMIVLAVGAVAQDAPPVPMDRPPGMAPSATTPAPTDAEDPAPAEAEEPAPSGPIVPLPRPRPDPAATQPPAATPATPAPAAPASPTPEPGAVEGVPEEPPAPPAPPRIYQTACPAVLTGRVEAETLPPIADDACGTRSPLNLTAVLANGRMVPVSGGVTTDCGIATVLPDWVADVDSYVFARENTRIEEVLVGTSYVCRNVNNASAGNLSFHALADALDVTGFRLADGRTVTVSSGWSLPDSPEGRLLRFAHDAACSRFTTTLGPEANALHADHFHVDLGCHGSRCTARLCE